MTNSKNILKNNSRIAIINRGEAAIRFIRAVNDYNFLHNTKLATIAFYIPAEEGALFVKQANEAYNLLDFEKKPSASSPYLNYDLLLNALKTTKCDAVWPGWGFVAEDDNFVSLLEEKNILFLGPSSHAMALLGDKIQAKKLAEKTKVPILPWSKKAIVDLEDAKKQALKIGYPVILKAANAGGGRGIRIVKSEKELPKQFTSAREETIRITNNDHVFIERLVEKSRHLEVQVVVDRHGNVNTLGVRDCSTQRRNQKVIEETPPPHFPEKCIKSIQKDASRLMLKAKYESAGTVEFIYDMIREEYYFMEVNTRLQVEHPITEQIYQVDLVQAQIDVARDNKVILNTDSRGHAVEVRLNAEDPENDFIPAPGVISVLKMPAGSGIRVDSGVEQDSEIPTDFDSMIAKIISYAPTREMAMAKLKRALQEMHIKIKGGVTNRAFLLELLNSKEVTEGTVDTKFIERFVTSKKRSQKKLWHIALLSCAIENYLQEYREELQNFQQQFSKSGYVHNVPSPQGKEIELQLQGNSYTFFIKSVGSNVFHVEIDGYLIAVSYLPKGEQRLLIYEGKRFIVQSVQRGDTIICEVDGVPHPIEMDSQGIIKATAPSLVIGISKQIGQSITKGDIVLTLEAMKMETAIFAPENGIIKNFYVQEGEQVAAGQPLVAVDSKEQDLSSKPKSERINFKLLSKEKKYKKKTQVEWEILEQEFIAIFLGYDAKVSLSTWNKLTKFVVKNPSYQKQLYSVIAKAIAIFISIENLFSSKRFKTESSAQALNCQELLAHFFKRTEDREQGLPEAFLDRLNTAIRWYNYRSMNSRETMNRCIFRIYKSYANSKMKAKVLGTVLFSLKDIAFFQKQKHDRTDLGKILDQLISAAQLRYPSLVDGAIHARYHLIDGPELREIREKNRVDLLETFENLCDAENADHEADLQKIINSGNYINFDLILLSFDKELARKKCALELLAMRFNRYRKFHSGKFVQQNNSYFYHLKYTEKRKIHHFILAIVSTVKPKGRIPDLYDYIDQNNIDNSEIMIFVSSPGRRNEKKEEKFVDKLPQCPRKVQFMYIGFFYKDLDFTYRTLEQNGNQWQENIQRRYFSPLTYNELRVDRWRNFELELLNRTKTVYLVRATSRENRKDQRLFVLCNVTDAIPQYDKEDYLTAIPTLEHSIAEAIYLIRTYQAAYGTRLYWNRIIMHIRSPLNINLKQIEKYAVNLAPRFYDLGLEKTVIYTHVDNEQQKKEMEFLFENVSGLHFSLRGRNISTDLIEPMDSYASKNVRCRRRGIVYPYEIIKMLTRPGHASEKFPRGSFKEYDLTENEQGIIETVPVDRPYGQNKCNIIFGIITNFSKQHPYGLKRVLILGDPSGDMGSLAEEECRRVNGAIDLATKRNLPVEWIPISSGARIDMKSGTENLDWTASTLRKIIEFTQKGGEINIIVAGTNVGAQSYWNAEATMLMHTSGLLLMTDGASMLLTGKKALDFSGSVSAENNLGIGGVERIMAPNGQAQIWVNSLTEAYHILFRHYDVTYKAPGCVFPIRRGTKDAISRNICTTSYNDTLGQSFTKIGDIFSPEHNAEKKKPFDMRQIMAAVVDQDFGHLERWQLMINAETAIVWETRIGGHSVCLLGMESRPLTRIGPLANDGPETWSGGTLFPQSSKKVARAINSYSDSVPVVIVANLSGFDGSPESLRNCQLEYGAEIGRAVVNFRGPIIFVVVARYHGGAYVVFSSTLNPHMKVAAIEGTYASVIGGAPAAAVVFPKKVQKDTHEDQRIIQARQELADGKISQHEFNKTFQKVYTEQQNKLAQEFDQIHSVKRAQEVGSIHDIIKPENLRSYLIESLEEMTEEYLSSVDS